MSIDSKSRNIPSLDGLRALSVGMVLVTHGYRSVRHLFPWFPGPFIASWGVYAGVGTFFVISGFLITHLLLKELNATGSISLKRFYLRRFFRIFPPFYVFLGVAFLLVSLGVLHAARWEFLPAATYTWNYLPGPSSHLLKHTWSLSLEEQFYLLWPLALVLLGSRRGTKLALALILLMPFSRIASYYLMPGYRPLLITMLHTGIDTIMFGCLLALLWDNATFNRMIRPLVNGRVAAAAVTFLLVAHPLLAARFRGTYSMVFGMTLCGISISLILLYAVRKPDSLFGRVLNLRPLRHLGIISYSIYLWQEMFTGQEASRYFPWNLLAILVCAELSYWIVERPSFRLRDRVEKWLRARREARQQPIASQAG